jgi:ATP-dependent RNA helicase RhlE
MNIRSVAVYGGARYDAQINGLRRGAEIVVATPGRLEDLIKRGAVSLEAIKYFILDEADHMLDLGFHPAMMRISAQIPAGRQTMLFSATMPPPIRKLSDHFLRDPVHVEAPQNQAKAHHITQHVRLVSEKQKRGLLVDMLGQKEVESCVIFVRTKRRADTLAANLGEIGLKVDALHGDMRQFLRRKVLDKFRAGQINILIATDVAARGIDIPAISHVVNYDMPESQDAYTHRIGRTGRAGKTGVAISYCNDADGVKLRQILATHGDDIDLCDADGNPVADHAISNKPAGRKPRSGDRRPPRPSRKHSGQGSSRDARDARDGGKGFGKGGDKPKSKSSGKPAGKTFGKPFDKSSDKPSGKTFGKPAGKAAGKPTGKPTGKRSDKPFGKSGGKPFGKSSENPSGHSSRWQDEKPSSDMPTRRKKKPASFSDGGSSEHRSRRGEAKPDAKPFHAKPKSHKPSSRPHAKSGMKAGGKSGGNFANKSGAKSGNKSGGSATLKRKR